MASWDDKLDDLQVRLTFLDDAVNDLSTADLELSQRLHAVERTLEAMRSEILSLRADNGHDHDPATEPPPPHY